MNILVTGAKGYIAKSLIPILEKEFKVISIYNNLEYNCLTDKRYELDLLNEEHIQSFIAEGLQIDIVIHIASKMASSDNINDMDLFYDNVKMYENLILILKYYKPSKLINFSSIAIYPNIDGIYDEESIVKPSVNNDALYGLSKFCGENILDHFLKKMEIKITHLRVSQVYSDDMREDRLYQVMKKELKEYNRITVYGNGERVSNFIDKSKLIEKVLFFIKNDKYGIFNIGDLNISYRAFADKIISKYGNTSSEVVLNQNGSKNKVYINISKFDNMEKECLNN